MTLLAPMGLFMFCFFELHACYMIFWTAFVYHSILETLAGWLIAFVIVGQIYDRDWLSGALQYALNPESLWTMLFHLYHNLGGWFKSNHQS